MQQCLEAGEITTFSFIAITEGNQIEPTDWEFNGEKVEDWDVEVNTEVDNNPTPTPSNNTYFIEAEDMNLSGGYRTEGNNFASGREVISLYSGDGNNNDSGVASFEFSGGTGYYNIIIDTFDENDGVAQIALEQNNSGLETFSLGKQLGSNVADDKTDVSLEILDVFVSSGDWFRIEGIEDGNQWTADHARVDAIEFVPIESN